MSDFSIELGAEQIADTRTREYFREVLSSFINGNFRSATVMLWSVAVADLIYKLQNLRDLYQDHIAKSILENTEAKQKANPNSPEWELALLEDVNLRTTLLEAGDYQNLIHLQKLRHLSAHPVLSNANLLFSPNKETTRSLIRNALEGLLLKPPIFSKNIVNEFVVDLAAKKALLPATSGLKQYLEAKYFVNLHPSIEKELVKALWKFCFRISNPDTDPNREINTRSLYLLYQRGPSEFRNFILQNADYFSEIASAGAPLQNLLAFLTECPALYSALKDTAKVPLGHFAQNDGSLFASATFLSNTLSEHVAKVAQLPYDKRRDIKTENWARLVARARDAGLLQTVHDIGIDTYSSSGSYDGADANFTRFIEPYLGEMEKERVIKLLAGINANSQTHGRGRAKVDHPKIADRAAALAIDISPYQQFLWSLPTAA
jgi:hypothetical protein